jgi:hypothetical protein
VSTGTLVDVVVAAVVVVVAIVVVVVAVVVAGTPDVVVVVVVVVVVGAMVAEAVVEVVVVAAVAVMVIAGAVLGTMEVVDSEVAVEPSRTTLDDGRVLEVGMVVVKTNVVAGVVELGGVGFWRGRGRFTVVVTATGEPVLFTGKATLTRMVLQTCFFLTVVHRFTNANPFGAAAADTFAGATATKNEIKIDKVAENFFTFEESQLILRRCCIK